MESVLKNFKNMPVLVIGDMMLDRYVYGEVNRISPEAPVPVLKKTKETSMLGGCGNVLANLVGLGAKPSCVAVIGQDGAGTAIKDLFDKDGIETKYLILDSTRPSNGKTRFVSGQQQIVRLDEEDARPVEEQAQKEIIEATEKLLPDMKAVILSDYGKGVLTGAVLQAVISTAQKYKVPVFVDPKGQDFSKYKGADFITPNKKELAEATYFKALDTDEDIEAAAQKIIEQCGIGCVVATRSEKGISVMQKGQMQAIHIPTAVREVYDVSGAGDTVIATLAVAIAAGADIESAARLANKAGGFVVGKRGTAAITLKELQGHHAADRILNAGLYSRANAKAQIARWKKEGLKVGFTNGCFDIIHHGHVSYLNQTKQHCDRLILGLNHDKSVKILKGESRPINDENARASVIGALGSVDMVVLFGAEEREQDNTPCEIIDDLRPDIIFKGGDYTIDQLPEAKVAMAYGGEAMVLSNFEGFSTTNIIAKSKGEAA